ncbi:PDS5B protein, partial [Polypterus senegalus]|nr:PDS5B protein [Polypterus senegalus]
MAHSKTRANDGKITYPPGVKEISDKISKEEMVRRLKMVVKTFMDMDQDSEEEKELYLNLALHLASDFFLKHPDKDVRLLVACCLADIFRIYAPEAPYTSPDKLKDIFMFITRQLKGLEDTKSPQFNRYFYLLENIAWVKSYNICFELEDSNEIFTQLYRTLFQVINNGHNQKVHMHMVDLMSSIICEGDTVSQELLDTILVNLVPAHKNLNKQAYDLAKALLKRTAQAIEPYITNFFNQVLMLGKTSVSDLSEHVFDLILELYNIDSHLLLSVLPQLEFKLKSNDNDERLQVVKLLAKMFGAKDSELAAQNKPLWQCYLGRFNDIHVPIRLECVKFASHCLMNHPDLAKDLTEYLKVRSHDPEEAIRHDVIVSIVTAAKKDLSLVNDHLLNFVRERTLDKRWRVRKEAMMGLAQIYKKYSLQGEAGKEATKQISWIKDKLLHIYYQNSIDDRLLVERIFAQYMVPHNLETTERMKCLYYLYATLDFNAVNALIKQVNKSIDGTADDEEEGVPTEQAIRAGLELLKVLSFTHPVSFHSAETFESLLGCLKMDDEKVAEAALQIFKNTGNKLEESFPHIKSVLLPVLQNKAKKGPPRQAKYAIHCIHAIFSSRDTQFAQIFEPLHKSLDPANLDQLVTPLTTIGHLALLAPEQFAAPLKSLVANFIVKDLLMNDRLPGKKTTKLWVPDEEVSPETMVKIQGIKLMVRWLLGMRSNLSKSGTSTLKMLTAILNSDGDLTEQGKMSKPDMSRLRLAAGCAILKLAQEPCYHEIITLDQYQLCALVINDECYQVRQAFAQKLHKGLSRLRLKLEYLAIFALCAKDPVKERRAHARQCLVKNINIRREYLKQHAAVSEKLLSLLPEYVVPYTIHLLAHDPDYVKVQDIEQLKDIKECLWFVLEILMSKNENNSHAFIRKMVENIKQTKDAQRPDDAKLNEKLYTVCDVAMNIIISKSTTYSLESPKDPVLPARYFTQPDKNFSNTKNYLPPEMKSFFIPGKPKAANVLGAVNKPLSAAGKQSQTKASRMETISNASSNSNPSSPGRSKGRLDSSEMDHSENEDITIMKTSPLPGKKNDKREDSDLLRETEKPRGRKKAAAVDQEERSLMDDTGQEQKPKRGRKRVINTSPSESDEQQWSDEKRIKDDLLEAEDEQNSPPKKARRGRPPKAASTSLTKEETPSKGRRGRKKAAPPVEEELDDEVEDEGDRENMDRKVRGRPPKTQRKSQHRAETSEVTDESVETTPQKRRGRPPKAPQSQPKKSTPSRGPRSRSVFTKDDSEDELDISQESIDDVCQEEDEEEEAAVSTKKASKFRNTQLK